MSDHPYNYDVFLSFTGGDRAMKDELREFLEAPNNGGYRCYDSDRDCMGDFCTDFTDAIDHSRVYVIILSDNLCGDPSVDAGRTYTEVMRECRRACELEARGRLNIVILSCSNRFNDIIYKEDDSVGHFFQSQLSRRNRISCSVDGDGTLSARTLDTVLLQCKRYIEARASGRAIMPQAQHLDIATEKLITDTSFSGRSNEIEETLLAFRSGKRAVVLYGLGGIGKTTLAAEIARRCEESSILSCPQIVHIRELVGNEDGLHAIVSSVKYEKNIYDSIAVLCERDRYERKLRALAELPENILLVIDNFNTVCEQDVKDLLANLSCRLLITTRATLREADSYKIIPVGSLSEDDAYAMFISMNGGQEARRDEFSTLYRFVGGHTITLCIMAKMSAVHRISLSEFLSALDGLECFDARVDFRHNDSNNVDTVMGHLKKLFDINGFSEGCCNILRSMCILGSGTIAVKDLMRVLGLTNRNDISELIGTGWLERRISMTEDGECEMLYIHPILSLLSANLLSPTQENTAGMIEHLLSLSESGRESMTYSDATLLSDNLYYACYVLASREGKLAHSLWTRFAEINHLLGDLDGTGQKVQKLSGYLADAGEGSIVTSYRDMLILERDPMRVDLLDSYVKTLKENSYNYKWVMRQLSVTFSHIVGVEKYKGFVASALEEAMNVAMERRDDAALSDLLVYSFALSKGFDRTMRRVKSYIKKRKREGAENAAFVLLEFMIDALSFQSPEDLYDLMKKTGGMVEDITERKYGKIIRMVALHPITFINQIKLQRTVENMELDDDPYVLYLKGMLNAFDELDIEGKIDAEKIIEAALVLHEARIEQQTTLASAKDAVLGALNTLSCFPESAVKRATERLSGSIDPDKISISGISSLQIATIINDIYKNEVAVEQACRMVSLMRRIRPEGHGDITTAISQYAEICRHFGKTKEAMEAYLQVYEEMLATTPDSAILADTAYKLLTLPDTAQNCGMDELYNIKDLAISVTSREESFYYTALCFYFYRLIDKVPTEGFSYQDVLKEIERVLTFTPQELRRFPLTTQNEILEMVRGLGDRFIMKKQYEAVDSLRSVAEQFKKSSKRSVRLRAKVYSLQMHAYRDYYRALDGYVKTSEQMVTVCLKNKTLQSSASVAAYYLIHYYCVTKKEMPFEKDHIRSKKNIQKFKTLKTRMLMLGFSSEEMAENDIEELYDIVKEVVLAHMANTSLALLNNNFNITFTAYKKIKRCEDFYTMIMESVMSAMTENTAKIKVIVGNELKKRNDLKRFNLPCPCGSGKKYKNCCHVHSPLNVGRYIKYPTCDEWGEKKHFCKECGVTYTEKLPPRHTALSEYEVFAEPTCTTPGEERAFCRDCGRYETRELAPRHKFDDSLTEIERISGSIGYEILKCGICGHTKKRLKLLPPDVDGK